MNTAAVTVVVPCYRCAATIARALESVASQTMQPAELVLVDDASGDGTVEILHSLQRQYGDWVKVVELPDNRGAASARNAGWNIATQPYVAFLDADDAWHPQKIEVQYAYMHAHPEVALSGHACRQLPQESGSAPQWIIYFQRVRPITWGSLLVRHAFVTPSVMLKREIPLRFAEGVRYMEDHRLWLAILDAGFATVKLEVELVAIYKPGYGAAGLSADMWLMEKGELANYRYFSGQGKIPLPYLMFLYCYSLVKYMRRLFVVRLLRRA
ncbi:glycosyltransferase family 2 protein [Candidatus Aalborgicola defluviihabitans]|uniref:glycosyltransferase family 2 protein n=1 Tax=Candidatus Aalborgicola defluviihabitans TaxID=3386187 RepID=UPI001E0BF056|nr:glycosyltransferase family 2 protein [Burkholderiales bacterium]MBK6569846.1 glycosyltransferase family 2 protein [Burkholderiales bacterium]MBK7315454.1 glycosyltransferase family 2 protein [Burkholderiales bacterium]